MYYTDGEYLTCENVIKWLIAKIHTYAYPDVPAHNMTSDSNICDSIDILGAKRVKVKLHDVVVEEDLYKYLCTVSININGTVYEYEDVFVIN